MNERSVLSRQFEEHRGHLRAVAFRMLGSVPEADDAVQEAWLRLQRTDVDGVENLAAWLTTVVSRVCLDMLRARTSRREEALGVHVPEPIVSSVAGMDPEHEALLGDAVGLALLVVLDTLAPAERLAFVLHDMFAVPFDDIAVILDRSPDSTRQLASRARRRVQGSPATPDNDLARQRQVVDAFQAASRRGDFDALVTLLDPDVVLRADYGLGRASRVVHGATAVAGQAITFSRYAEFGRPVLVNGVAGVLTAPDGTPFSLMAFTVVEGRIVAIDIVADPDRLGRIDPSLVGEGGDAGP